MAVVVDRQLLYKLNILVHVGHKDGLGPFRQKRRGEQVPQRRSGLFGGCELLNIVSVLINLII